MKILVLPDTHGRQFWRKPCENVEQYDRVIFLGDYLDPYDFEGISVEDAIDNFKDILLMAKDNDKVVMLLGNHDMPYYNKMYYGFNSYHHRHSNMHHKEICKIFKEYEDLFKVSHVEDDVLFTHAGAIYRVKQIFGHSLQLKAKNLRVVTKEDKNLKLVNDGYEFGNHLEFRNCKMLDNAKAYELDTETFTVKAL